MNSKPMTIEDVAEMLVRQGIQITTLTERMNEGFVLQDQKTNTKIEHLAEMVANGFQSIQMDVQQLKQETKTRFIEMEEKLVVIRRDILGLHDLFPSRYSFDQLAQRVSIFEEGKNKKKK